MRLKEITLIKLKESILNIKVENISVIIFALLVISAMFLFALEDRYRQVMPGQPLFFDTWTGRIFEAGIKY